MDDLKTLEQELKELEKTINSEEKRLKESMQNDEVYFASSLNNFSPKSVNFEELRLLKNWPKIEDGLRDLYHKRYVLQQMIKAF